MRSLAPLGLALVLALAVPGVEGGGEDDPCWDHASVGPTVAGAEMEHGTCYGETWSVAVRDPNGRTELRWYDDSRGVGMELHRPPRFVAWWEDADGCHLVLYAFGAEELGCVAGAPPSPSHVPR